MRIDFHKRFDKQYKKLPVASKKKFENQLAILISNQNNPVLNNHALKGKYTGYRSINVTGDIRAIYIPHSKDHIEFAYIGSHAQLYK